MPKPNKFPVLITAAQQQHLDSPAWPHVLSNWKARFQRVRVLIPSSAKVDEGGGVYVRMKEDRVMLADCMEWLVKSLDSLHTQAVLCDPLVVFHAGLLQLIDPQWLQRRSLGNAWMATGTALKIDAEGAGDTYEDEAIRWFAGGDNAFKVLQNGYVDKAVPMVPGLWSGYFAGLCQQKVTGARYFDVTRLKIVGSAMPAVGDVDPTGFSHWATNTPSKRYSDLVPAEA